ncbi:MAG: zinc ribbon domain-containing protein [Myxococcota bacterium]|nr:zinc ribbon domain-containing protein [Myxococcota bacterium]
MPTYEYGCDACGGRFEREQRIVDPPLRDCPLCGASQARRLISQGNFILKGGGWYADLYSSRPASKNGNGETKPDGTSSTGDQGETKKAASSGSETVASPPAASEPKGTSERRSAGSSAAS